MKVWIFMALSVISAPAFAQEIGGSYPDLSITGIHNKDELSKYLNSLKAAAAAKDVAAISKSNIYPLRVNAKPKRSRPDLGGKLLRGSSSMVFVFYPHAA